MFANGWAVDITAGTFAVTFFEGKDVFRIITAERQSNKGVQKEKEAEETWQR